MYSVSPVVHADSDEARNTAAARPAAELVATLACAVQFAHQSGFIHRDLKPANILLSADSAPKITDFGLARSIDAGPEFTLTGARIGTPSCMAPNWWGATATPSIHIGG